MECASAALAQRIIKKELKEKFRCDAVQDIILLLFRFTTAVRQRELVSFVMENKQKNKSRKGKKPRSGIL